jgi:hypothetical protein
VVKLLEAEELVAEELEETIIIQESLERLILAVEAVVVFMLELVMEDQA